MHWDAMYEQEKRAGAASGSRASASRTDVFGDIDADVNMDNDNGFGDADDIDMGRQNQQRGGNKSAQAREAEEEEEAFGKTPLGMLTRHWVNERHAPDILPAQEELLGGLLDHLRVQTRNVQILRDDPSTSESEHIRIMLVQTEIERVKFIVRSYIRTRLFKIEKFARYVTQNAEVQTRLTAAEREHASRHAKLTDQHLFHSVLQSLPEAQAHLDDTPVFYPSMVTSPDLTTPVFVHALADCPPVTLPDGLTLQMKKGHISLVGGYGIVERLVQTGDVELV